MPANPISPRCLHSPCGPSLGTFELLGATLCWWHMDGILADFVGAVLRGFCSESCLELVEQQDLVPEQYDGLQLGVSGGVLRAGGTHNWGSPAHGSSVESSLMLAALIRAIRGFFQGDASLFREMCVRMKDSGVKITGGEVFRRAVLRLLCSSGGNVPAAP